MSILLDALKKSEAQRQLGKTPTLDSPLPAEISSAAGNNIWIPAVMILLAAAAIAWVGVTQFQRPEPVAGGMEQASVRGKQSVGTDNPAPETTDREQRTAKTPVLDYSEAHQPAVSLPATGRSPGAAVDRQENFRSGSAQPQVADRRPMASASAGQAPLSVRMEAPPAEEQAQTADARQQRTDRLEPFVADSISYWQVPQSVREDMPAMRMTVLVYAEEPQSRFLLIDGQRLREKDELDKGLVLEEIQQDRAIFTYRSYRFYLKN